MVFNNAEPSKRKKRPARVVPKTYVEELDDLWHLRRAAFASVGDADRRESTAPGMVRRGVPCWVHPRTGERLSRLCIIRALRAALLRMGMSPERAARVTMYWLRKGHQTFVRNRAKGVGDKFISEQAGHSEDVMKGSYDSPGALARARHLSEFAWGPLGVGTGPMQEGGPTAQRPSEGRGAEPGLQISSEALGGLAQSFLSLLNERGITPADRLQSGEVSLFANLAAQRAGLLCSFQEAATTLGVDIRTLERWAESNRVRAIRIDGHRYLMRAQVAELSQCLTPDEAGRQLGLSGRQVRNLIKEGRILGAISMGKNWLIPWGSVRALILNKRVKIDINRHRPCLFSYLQIYSYIGK